MDRPISLSLRSVDLANEPAFQLGSALVDPQAHECVIGDTATHLQPQTLKVLVALHDKSGHVVTREELIDRCWNGRIVGDDVINRCISLLRPLATKSGGFRIQTIPRSGYRLIEASSAVAPKSFPWALAFASLGLVAVSVGAFALFSQKPVTDFRRPLVVSVDSFSADPGSGAGNLAADAQDSVVRMLNESGLSVKLAGSADSVDPSADLVVSGTVGNSPNGKVAVIRIEDVPRHAIIFSHRLEASTAEIADLPDRIGANFASALSWTGPLILLDRQHPSDPAFLTALLDQPSNPDFDALAGFAFMRRNAPNAPGSAIAQLAYAMDTGFAIGSIPREERSGAIAAGLSAAARARRLAPEFGDVYIPWCLLHSSAQWRGCEDHLRAGLVTDAQAPFVGFFLAELMNEVGRTDDAASLASASLAEDKYVPAKMALAIGLDAAVENADADSIYRGAVRLWPQNKAFFWRRVEGLLQRGDFAGIQKFEQETKEQGYPEGYQPTGPIANAIADKSKPRLDAECPKSSVGLRSIECMLGYSRLGALDDAFAFAAILYPVRHGRTPAQDEAMWLARPYAEDAAFLTSEGAAGMRRDPRYLPLAQRLGLLDYWRTGRLPDFCTQAHEPVCARIARQ